MKNGKLKSAVRSLQQQSWPQVEKLGSDEIRILKGGTGRETSDCNGYCNSYTIGVEEEEREDDLWRDCIKNNRL